MTIPGPEWDVFEADFRHHGLSIRALNALWNNGVRTKEAFVAIPREQVDRTVRTWRQIGHKTRAEYRALHDKMTEFIVAPEPPPVPNNKPAVWGLVIADMKARDDFGRQKYGTPLQPNNGRDALKDAFQEACDLAVYLRSALYERDGR